MLKLLLIFSLLVNISSEAAKLKDIAQVRGAKFNQLTGYGIIVGLTGTGDRGLDLTSNSLGLALKGMGVQTLNDRVETRNAAAVVLTATLSPFAKLGSRIDVHVASLGTASSLDGGTLIVTPLKGADGNVYAMAQGRIVVSKKPEEGSRSSQKNYVAGEIPVGATIEREIAADWQGQKQIHYQLFNADFTTAARTAFLVNQELSGKYATAQDAGIIEILVPPKFEGRMVDFISSLENLEVETSERAKVVINSRAGTVVVGNNVRVMPVTLAHQNLRVEVLPVEKENPAPAVGPLAPGATPPGQPPGAPPTQSSMVPLAQKKEKTKTLHFLKGQTSVEDLVQSLNDIGASPEELIAVFQALKNSGALLADLEIL